MSLFADMSLPKPPPYVMFCTSTLLDSMTGMYTDCESGQHLFNAGLSASETLFHGANGVYKSTNAVSFAIRAVCRYPKSELLIIDTEGSVSRDEERVFRMAGPNPPADLRERVHFAFGKDMPVDNIRILIEKTCEKKEKDKKQYMVTYPHLGKDLKPCEYYAPTFIIVDSLSQAYGEGEDSMLDEEGLSGKKTKTMWMNAGVDACEARPRSQDDAGA